MNKYNLKTIYFTSLVSIVLTLTLVAYFSDFQRHVDENEIEFFLSGLLFVCLFFAVPAIIIYRLLFGKFSKNALGDFVILFWFITFAFSFYSIHFYSKRFLIEEIAISLSIILGLIFTIILSKFIFLSKFEEQIKLCKDVIDKENLSNLKK